VYYGSFFSNIRIVTVVFVLEHIVDNNIPRHKLFRVIWTSVKWHITRGVLWKSGKWDSPQGVILKSGKWDIPQGVILKSGKWDIPQGVILKSGKWYFPQGVILKSGKWYLFHSLYLFSSAQNCMYFGKLLCKISKIITSAILIFRQSTVQPVQSITLWTT
jgi:hypothetical protein